jgi:hypothetical protein
MSSLNQVEDPVELFRRRWRESAPEVARSAISVVVDDAHRYKVHRKAVHVLTEATHSLRSQLAQNLEAARKGIAIDMRPSFLYEHREIGRLVVNHLIEGEHVPSVELGRGRYLEGEVVAVTKSGVSQRSLLLPSSWAGDREEGLVLCAIDERGVVDLSRVVPRVVGGYVQSVSRALEPSLPHVIGDELRSRPVVVLREAEHHTLVVPRSALGYVSSLDAFERVVEYLEGEALSQEVVQRAESDLKAGWRSHLLETSRSLAGKPATVSSLRQQASLVQELHHLYSRSSQWARFFERGIDRAWRENDVTIRELRREPDRTAAGWER